MSRNQSPQLIAGGTINPSTFVKISTAADNTALAAGVNDRAIGIAQVGVHDTPGLTGAGSQAASSGDTIEIFGIGDICLLKSGGFTHGDPLKSDASGQGVTATVAGTDIVCAYALESAASGEYGRVVIVSPSKL